MVELSNRINNKKVVILIKLFLVLLATSLTIIVCGLFAPFFLLASGILPSLGVGGVVYFFGGGIFGLLFGSITSSVSIFRSKKILTPYYKILIICLISLSALYLLSYLFFGEAYSHV